MRKKHRKILLVALKILVAGVLLAWVLSKVHWHDYVVTRQGQSWSVVEEARREGQVAYRVTSGTFWKRSETVLAADLLPIEAASRQVVRQGFASAIRHVRVAPLGGAAVALLLCLVISALRWRILLEVQDIRISRWETLRLAFLGQFFNYIVPGTVGGDLVKAYYVSRHTPKTAAVLVSVFVDRVMGFADLALLAAVMILVVLAGDLPGIGQMRQAGIAVAAVSLLVTLLLAFILSPRFRRALHLQKIYQHLPISRQIAAAGDAARIYGRNPGGLLKAAACSLVAHGFFVGSIALMGVSLSLTVPWHAYFVYVPLIYIVGAVPVTPGGVGVIETLFQAFLGALCGPSKVLALALLARIIPMLWGIPGAIVAISGPKLPQTDALEAELGIEHTPDA